IGHRRAFSSAMAHLLPEWARWPDLVGYLRRSISACKASVSAPGKDQRLARACLGGDDLADDDCMIATVVPRKERAFEPGEAVLDEGDAGHEIQGLETGESIAVLHEGFADIRLLGAEDVDRELLGRGERRVPTRGFRRRPEHERRVDRDRREGIRGDPERAMLGSGGDDRRRWETPRARRGSRGRT